MTKFFSLSSRTQSFHILLSSSRTLPKHHSHNNTSITNHHGNHCASTLHYLTAITSHQPAIYGVPLPSLARHHHGGEDEPDNAVDMGEVYDDLSSQGTLLKLKSSKEESIGSYIGRKMLNSNTREHHGLFVVTTRADKMNKSGQPTWSNSHLREPLAFQQEIHNDQDSFIIHHGLSKETKA
ncbi:hypothetical protein JHK85_040571 [Glycine max]|nr:hypothetical protein JHK85_040571 [Glycine max]